MQSNNITNNLSKGILASSILIRNIISAYSSENQSKIYKKRNYTNPSFFRYFHLTLIFLLCLLAQCSLKSQNKVCSKIYLKSNYSRKLEEHSSNQGSHTEREYIQAERENWDNVMKNISKTWNLAKEKMVNLWNHRRERYKYNRWMNHNMENTMKKMDMEYQQNMDSYKDDYFHFTWILEKGTADKNQRHRLWMQFMELKEDYKEFTEKWIREKQKEWERNLMMVEEYVQHKPENRSDENWDSM
ncbi:Plasmodium exported protein, unknown function [Plasmodium relictum]|uniref:Uncharacterized protein n=1 Tax=Plasmodium relictum TaxID=85471 RepID=A0A1J1GNN7_PLARL|nr:Plasmodium exported protein, unknown function [Plasmodium relictum]CRG84541.1 Plasmodium exported protein, unknown function [Plasmodium relictum]